MHAIVTLRSTYMHVWRAKAKLPQHTHYCNASSQALPPSVGRLQLHGHVFSFFTRNLARLAPDVVSLLQARQQAVDPNLQRLADAFETVASKLGPEKVSALMRGKPASGDGDAEDGHGAEARCKEAMMPEDVQEGLQALRQEMQPGGVAQRKKRKADNGYAFALLNNVSFVTH
jgi:hypothetical protein